MVEGENTKSNINSSSTSDINISFLRAARSGDIEKVIDGLTRQGVDINCSNANGLNALHLAAKEGYVELVQELINRGAKVESATKKGNTALHVASLGGKLRVAKLLVEHGSPINAQSQLGFTPLYMAAQENKEDIVKFLLDHGADPSLTTEEGYTPLAVALQQKSEKAVTVLLEYGQGSKVKLPALHIAAKKDDVSAVKLLLRSETADQESMVELVNDTTKSGFTPLHIASHYGKHTVARLLIDMGADVNYKAKNAIAPMHVAAKWGQLSMIVLLVEKGAYINIQTRDGLTPLHCAARSGYVRVVDYLLENNADHSAKTRNGLSPLHMACQGDHADCARLILHAKANVNEVSVDYLTALHVTAHYGHVKTAKLLLDRLCDVNARALNGFTPLHIACKKNRIKVVELLLKFGALIEATTESGLTPLHVSSFMGNMSIVLTLLNNGADVDGRTMRGETPLHLASRSNQIDVIRILLRNKADVNAKARELQIPLHIAARMGSVDSVLLLLQHGADVEAVTKDGYTPLHIAAKEGHEEVIGVLIDQSASPNSVTKKGMTPLHISAKYGQHGVARLLLQRGAQPDMQGRNGLTALHVAAHYNRPTIVLLLLEEFRASPHCQAKNGYTPLHIAAKKNQMDIATSLLEYGARANAESKNGFTPLHLAAQEGHTDMVSLLLENGANSNCYATNGLTPMHLCAQEDHVHVAEILCKYGARIDPTTKAGYTPLHTASHFGQINMVRFLLELGAEVDAKTRLGYTPLHQGAQQGHVLVVNILLKAGATPEAKTNNGVTALQIARRLGYVSLEQVLQGVTTVSASTENLHEDFKYSMVGPEKMEEHSISDSEEEQDADDVFSHQYPFLSSRDDYMQGAARSSYSFKNEPSSREQEAAMRTHNFDDSELYAEESYVEQLSPISKGSIRQFTPKARSRTSLNSAKQSGAFPSYSVESLDYPHAYQESHHHPQMSASARQAPVPRTRSQASISSISKISKSSPSPRKRGLPRDATPATPIKRGDGDSIASIEGIPYEEISISAMSPYQNIPSRQKPVDRISDQPSEQALPPKSYHSSPPRASKRSIKNIPQAMEVEEILPTVTADYQNLPLQSPGGAVSLIEAQPKTQSMETGEQLHIPSVKAAGQNEFSDVPTTDDTSTPSSHPLPSERSSTIDQSGASSFRPVASDRIRRNDSSIEPAEDQFSASAFHPVPSERSNAGDIGARYDADHVYTESTQPEPGTGQQSTSAPHPVSPECEDSIESKASQLLQPRPAQRLQPDNLTTELAEDTPFYCSYQPTSLRPAGVDVSHSPSLVPQDVSESVCQETDPKTRSAPFSPDSPAMDTSSLDTVPIAPSRSKVVESPPKSTGSGHQMPPSPSQRKYHKRREDTNSPDTRITPSLEVNETVDIDISAPVAAARMHHAAVTKQQNPVYQTESESLEPVAEESAENPTPKGGKHVGHMGNFPGDFDDSLDRNDQFIEEQQLLSSNIPTHSIELAGDGQIDNLYETELWKTQLPDDSAPPDEKNDEPVGGVFIPPKGEDPGMYDIYTTPEIVTASEAAPQYMEDSSSETGYVLTTSGEVIGPDGKVLHGADRKPIVLVHDKRSLYSLAADGTIYGPDHKPYTDAEGNIIRVKPSGNKIILEPSGKLTLDDKRNPLVVEAGTQLVTPMKDGRIKVNDKQVIDADTGKAAVLRHATPDVLVVVGPDMKTVNLVGKPVTVVGGSVLIAPGLQNYIVFANGRPVIGEDDEPVCVPAGSKLVYPNVDRTVTNSAGVIVTDDSMKPVRVVDKFCAAVILSPNNEVVTTAQGKIVRVPASSHFASAGDDGTLHGADKKKILGPDGKAIKVPPMQQVVVDKHGLPVLGADSKPILVLSGSTLLIPHSDGRLVKPDGSDVLVNGSNTKINPESAAYVVSPDFNLGKKKRALWKSVMDRDGQFVRVAPGSQVITPGKDGKIKGLDGKRIHTADGKSVKVDGGKEPVIVVPGNKLLKNKDSKALRVPVGSQVVVPDSQGYVFSATGEPVLDKQGRQIQILPNVCKVILGPEDTPLTDKNGKIITVPGGSKLTIPGQEEAILGPDGKAITNEKGVPLGVDQGSSLLTVASDHFVYLPDGSKLTAADGKVFKHTPGAVIAVGPDYHPVIDKDGAVVVVPAGSVVIAPRQKYVLDNEGHPVADHKGRSITVDNDTIILQADDTGKIQLPDGSKLCDSVGRPIITAPEQEVLVDAGSLQPILDARGQPVVTKPGVNIAQPGQLLYIVCPDKTVVEDDNSQPVWVTPGTRLLTGDNDGYATVGQAGKLLDKTQFPLKIPAGQEVVVGPDDKPVCYKNTQPVFVPEGSVIMAPGENFLRDVDGNPVKDSQGHPLTVKPGTQILEVADDGSVTGADNVPVTDKYGKPVVAAPRSLLLVSPAGQVVNSPRGRPVPVPRGSRITPVQHEVVVDSAGDPVLEENGLPLQVTPGTKIMEAGADGHLVLPDGQYASDVNGAVVLLPAGECALIGPDGKALVDPKGEVVRVPQGSSVHSSPAPPLQKVQRPEIIEEIIGQEVAETAQSANVGVRGAYSDKGSPTSPPPLPSTLPPGLMPWSVFTLKRGRTIEASYSGTDFGRDFNPDNVVVDRNPVFTGDKLQWKSFLVSFMVDARGGAMRGCRHAGVRIVIPPGMATGPTRITCRLVKKEKLPVPPPLCDGEALASRVVSLGPAGTSFLGPVIIEVPHFASLQEEREVLVVKSQDGRRWEEHKVKPTDDLVLKAVNNSFDDIEPLDELAKKRITRIVTTQFPKYFALVSRVKIETSMVGPEGAIISSTVVPQAQAVFPAGALKKPTKIGLQAHPVPADIVARLYGNRAAVSPVVTVEPRRRQFRKQITLTFPLPRAATKGMTNQYTQRSATLRLLSSMADGENPAEWKDVTDSTTLKFVNDCVSFTTTFSARFWLVDYQQVHEVISMANTLYKEICNVPFVSRFVVFAKRHEQKEARLRVFCMTDDKIDKTLETQQYFTEVARSRDIEVLENKEQWLEMAGNLIPITRSDDTQLHIKFQAFQENRLPFIVRIRDQDREPTGRVAFMREPKVAKGEPSQMPICNLQIKLPEYDEDLKTASDLDLSRTADFNERYRLYRDHGVSFISENIVSANLRLPEIAEEVGSDWPRLAQELNISNKEVDRIQADGQNEQKQSLSMLKLWMKQAGVLATGNTLERALQRINRDDVIIKCIHSVKPVTSEKEKEVARKELGVDGAKDVVIEKDAAILSSLSPVQSSPELVSTTEAVDTEHQPFQSHDPQQQSDESHDLQQSDESPDLQQSDELHDSVHDDDSLITKHLEEFNLLANQQKDSESEDDGSEIVPVNNATRSPKPSLTEEELNEQKAQREEALHSFIAELELISSAVAISDTEDDDAESVNDAMEESCRVSRPQLDEDMLESEAAIEQQSAPTAESAPVVFASVTSLEAQAPVDLTDDTVDTPQSLPDTYSADDNISKYHTELAADYNSTPADEPHEFSQSPADEPQDYRQSPADEPQDLSPTSADEPQDSSQSPADEPQDYSQSPADEPQDSSQSPADEPQDYSQSPADEPQEFSSEEVEPPSYDAPGFDRELATAVDAPEPTYETPVSVQHSLNDLSDAEDSPEYEIPVSYQGSTESTPGEILEKEPATEDDTYNVPLDVEGAEHAEPVYEEVSPSLEIVTPLAEDIQSSEVIFAGSEDFGHSDVMVRSTDLRHSESITPNEEELLEKSRVRQEAYQTLVRELEVSSQDVLVEEHMEGEPVDEVIELSPCVERVTTFSETSTSVMFAEVSSSVSITQSNAQMEVSEPQDFRENESSPTPLVSTDEKDGLDDKWKVSDDDQSSTQSDNLVQDFGSSQLGDANEAQSKSASVDSCEHVTAAPLAGEVDHYLDDGSYLSDEPGQ